MTTMFPTVYVTAVKFSKYLQIIITAENKFPLHTNTVVHFFLIFLLFQNCHSKIFNVFQYNEISL